MTARRQLISAAEFLRLQLGDAGIEADLEFRHSTTRRWRWDVAVRAPRRVLVEIDGGTWMKSRAHSHSRGPGQKRDREKQNDAIAKGFLVLRFAPEEVFRGDAMKAIAGLLAAQTGGR